MTGLARRGLEAFLKRKAAPPSESRETMTLPDGTEIALRIRRHPTARRLTLRLAPDGSEVRVTIPRWAPFSEARAFALSRTEWLAGQRRAVPQRAPVMPGSTVAYRGRALAIEWQALLPRRPAILGNTIRVGGPAEGIEQRLRRWLESEALALCGTDLAYFCDIACQPVPDLRLSRAQRRWGSCSSSGTVRINWRLVMAPDHVRRSVVAHEVAHLVHFDHSPAFHALLAQIYDGDIAEADRWLKRHGRTLHAAFG
ncbi:M48 family metallopeptidase [Croceicoccus bisphenolivorans]|uniref:M48 family metallopeptidase n=1 Tax=Croceicoccus bisphenolivorans TaxID=1783232 RepID=UPI00082F15F8|nr:SprT family zinc-dependent metalloprotease [Croceicoccus bisphenolivorans]